MPPKEILKYILDIESIIYELEQVVQIHSNDFSKFNGNFMAVRTVERNLQIIGEAIRKMTKIDNQLNISGTKHIIGLRNMIVHSYDSIDPTTLWRILLKDIPLLKTEIESLKG